MNQILNFSEIQQVNFDENEVSELQLNGIKVFPVEKYGLFDTNSGVLIYTWDELIAKKYFYLGIGGLLRKGDASSSLKEALSGDLILSDKILDLHTSSNYVPFYGFSKLTSIIFHENFIGTGIGNNTFGKCSSLKNMVLPNSINTINDSAFTECSSLETIILPNQLTAIGSNVFYKCSSLENIEIPNTVTSLGSEAFGYCTNLKSIKISNGLTKLNTFVFHNCTSLKTIYLPSSITSISGYITQSDGEVNSPFIGVDSSCVIYCGASSAPSGWGEYWNCYNNSNSSQKLTVKYGYTYEQYLKEIGR